MWMFVNVAMLVFATVIAGAAAVSVYWLLLRATLQIMRPATVRTGPVFTGSVRTEPLNRDPGRGPSFASLGEADNSLSSSAGLFKPFSRSTPFAAVPTLFKEGSK